MRIQADDRVPFAREIVYRTYRDRLVDLVPYLPNVASIEVRDRADEGDVVRFVNAWRAKDEIPQVARSILRPEMLSWLDHATWRASEWTTEWRIEMGSFADAVDCRGKNEFVEDRGATLIRIRGDLHIDLRLVRGVPRILAGTVGPVVEKFVVAMITPNLSKVSRGIEKLLRAEGSG